MSYASKNTLLSLDIGSDIIKAAIVRRLKNGDLEVLGTGAARQLAGSMRFGEILNPSAVTDACHRAIEAVEENSGAFARQVVANISSELIKSTISRVHYTRSDSERIFSESELSAVFEKIETATEKKFAREIAFETESEDEKIELLDSYLVSCVIDGKRVDSPIDHECEDVVIEYYTSFVPVSLIDSLKEIFSDLKLDLISLSTTPYALYRTLAPKMPRKESAIYLSIDSDCSHFIVMEDGILRAAETFSLGTKIIGKDLSIWTSGLKIALTSIPHLTILPPKIVLCGSIAESDEFQKYLALGNWFNELPFDRRPTVETLEKSNLPKYDGEFSLPYISAISLTTVGFEDLDSIS